MHIAFPPPSGRLSHKVFPVFMPFAGCPHRCLFCAQNRQTGQDREALDVILSRTDKALQARHERNASPVEVAFYGGTFTCLSEAEQEKCLSLAARWRQRGVVCAVRCSTRPDAVDVKRLAFLRERGVGLVELGVQSFSDAALKASGRGYTGRQAREACKAVTASGLGLGIQLLPGMPGGTEASFLLDTHLALEEAPSCMRMYPCLVIEGTGLATLWRKGKYQPWTLDSTVRIVGCALSLAWERGVPVIRLSLAPEPELEAAVLAGPRHPALGNMIQSEALFGRLMPVLEKTGISHARFPAYCQGIFSGYKKQMVPRWRSLGLDIASITWTSDDIAAWDAGTGAACSSKIPGS